MSLSPAQPTGARRLHDPAARPRATALLLAACLLWPLLQAAGWDPAALLNPDNLQVVGGFASQFFPPASERDFLALLAQATLETLAMATAGLALAMALALPLSYWVSGAARERVALNPLARALLTVLRGVPELVWALLFVRVFGLGPAAGVLALGLTYGGMLAKVYAEIFESVDATPARALRLAGASRLTALLYGLLPQAARELASYTVYRWECALRASAVMGFVGAGGLGQLMDQSMKMLNGGEASAIVLCFVLLVLAADALSTLLRRALQAAPAPRALAPGWRSALLALALAGALYASLALLAIDWGALFGPGALHAMAEFAGGFVPPDTSPPWLARVAQGMWETLAISVLGTLLAAALGLLLALPLGRLWRAPADLLLNLLRAVPELVWATFTALAVGLGPFAGALALALHTTGVLGRLYAQALQNTPAAPSQALRLAGSGRALAFVYGTLAVAARQLLAYTLYRWEMNIRMAAVLGFVGAGGLGQLLYVELSLFRHAQAGTVIAAMLLLSILVDWASAWLRRRMG